MKILAMDSTARVATVAVAEDSHVLACYTTDSGLTQSELLLPMARSALASAHLGFSDIDLFALTVGPGSFTGVRIGVSLVKGLAFGKNIPCAPVSVLEAMAEGLCPLGGIYCPVMDARRGQVYNALFREENGEPLRLTPDRALSIDELLAELTEQYPGIPVAFVGDGAATVEARAKDYPRVTPMRVPHELRLPSAAAVARCGLRAAARGELVDDISLSPLYLRLPQAERERLAREQNERESK